MRSELNKEGINEEDLLQLKQQTDLENNNNLDRLKLLCLELRTEQEEVGKTVREYQKMGLMLFDDIQIELRNANC